MKLLKQSTTQVAGYDAAHQRWIMDGIKGESVVFLESDVSSISDGDLTSMVMELDLANPDSQSTIVRNSSGFAFVNLNFSS
ncbi:MAG: hypothetical protein V7720_01475 [Halioglobus sp.]